GLGIVEAPDEGGRIRRHLRQLSLRGGGPVDVVGRPAALKRLAITCQSGDVGLEQLQLGHDREASAAARLLHAMRAAFAGPPRRRLDAPGATSPACRPAPPSCSSRSPPPPSPWCRWSGRRRSASFCSAFAWASPR